MWPAWIAHHIRAINKRLAAGETLDDIARTLSGDWEEEAKKWVRYDVKAAFERIERDKAIDRFAEWASDTVYGFLKDIGVERPGRIDDKVSRVVSSPRFVNRVLELLRQGYAPMMVVTRDGVRIIPDFALGSAVGAAAGGGQPLLAVPIRDAFVDAFADVDPTLSNEPIYVPAMLVEDRAEKKARSRKYHHRSQWDIQIEK